MGRTGWGENNMMRIALGGCTTCYCANVTKDVMASELRTMEDVASFHSHIVCMLVCYRHMAVLTL